MKKTSLRIPRLRLLKLLFSFFKSFHCWLIGSGRGSRTHTPLRHLILNQACLPVSIMPPLVLFVILASLFDLIFDLFFYTLFLIVCIIFSWHIILFINAIVAYLLHGMHRYLVFPRISASEIFHSSHDSILMVAQEGLEPPRPKTKDLKSFAPANYATGPKVWWTRQDSNLGSEVQGLPPCRWATGLRFHDPGIYSPSENTHCKNDREGAYPLKDYFALCITIREVV